MDATKSSANHAHSSADEPLRGCFACYEGVVFLGRLVEDPETGEEAEITEYVPCRRCDDNR